MRQIKFRVWDKKYNRFSEEPFFRITISKNGKIHNSENDTWYDYDERYVIELFTGLLDKNGEEIYEGDKVKYFQPYANKWETHIVKWDDMWACFGLFEDGNDWCKESDWQKIKDIEIIGNIHETL